MVTLENGKGRGAAAVETASNVQESARETEAPAVSGSGRKFNGPQREAALPSIEKNATTETSVMLPSIDFSRSGTDLTPQQRRGIQDALRGVDPGLIEKVRVEIHGGNSNGILTPVRADKIQAEISEALGRSIDVEPRIVSAEKGANPHKLDANVYITLRDEAVTAGNASNRGTDKFHVSLGGGLNGLEVQVEKEGLPWDLRIAQTSLAATRSLGTDTLWKDNEGKKQIVDFRAGPFIDNQLDGDVKVGGMLLAESNFSGTKPYIGVKVGAGSDGLEKSLVAGFTVDILGGALRDETKK